MWQNYALFFFLYLLRLLSPSLELMITGIIGKMCSLEAF
jgi:hypothetical protein